MSRGRGTGSLSRRTARRSPTGERSSSPAGKRHELVVRSIAGSRPAWPPRGRRLSCPSFGGFPCVLVENRLQIEEGGMTGGTAGGTAGGTPVALPLTALLCHGGGRLERGRPGDRQHQDTLLRDGKRSCSIRSGRGATSGRPCRLTGIPRRRGDVSRRIRLRPDRKERRDPGRANAPSWMRSGGWLVSMDDRDDGHRVLSSDLCAVDRAGKRRVPAHGDAGTIGDVPPLLTGGEPDRLQHA